MDKAVMRPVRVVDIIFDIGRQGIRKQKIYGVYEHVIHQGDIWTAPSYMAGSVGDRDDAEGADRQPLVRQSGVGSICILIALIVSNDQDPVAFHQQALIALDVLPQVLVNNRL